jgi:chemotaxis protein MotB
VSKLNASLSLMKSLPLLLVAALLCQSCIVSKKKYDDILAQKVRTDGELADRSAELDSVSGQLTEANTKVAQLKSDTMDLGEDLRENSAKLANMNNDFEQLNAYYKNLLTSSGKTNRDLAENREQLLAIQSNLERTRKMNDSLSTSLSEREKKVEELESVVGNRDKATQDLRATVSNALLSFKESDLTVNVRNGKVYVSLAEQLLFGSGSVEVDKKGVTALQQLAKAIKDHQDIQIMVEGHTDNVPVSRKSQYMQDNWDLSVMRATSIVRILTTAGLSPKQVTAAGRGEYLPLAANDNDQTRQKNRRTEIVITPNLDEIFKLLETK